MKPLLVIGLGNPLMGDEGIGWHVAERLSGDPRLPALAEVVCGGTDLLRYAAQMEQSRRAIVVDALRDDAEPGSVWAFEEPGGEPGGAGATACQPVPSQLPGLDNRQDNAHCLSAVQAIQLLRMTVQVPITLLGISIRSANVQAGLSPELAARMPGILDRVLRELAKVQI
ncbi:MAG TPA: hydrogenase maturation protease [Bryobacteraceae bacterium]